MRLPITRQLHRPENPSPFDSDPFRAFPDPRARRQSQTVQAFLPTNRTAPGNILIVAEV